MKAETILNALFFIFLNIKLHNTVFFYFDCNYIFVLIYFSSGKTAKLLLILFKLDYIAIMDIRIEKHGSLD